MSIFTHSRLHSGYATLSPDMPAYYSTFSVLLFIRIEFNLKLLGWDSVNCLKGEKGVMVDMSCFFPDGATK